MNNLAVSLRLQGKYAEAEAMHRQTLKLIEAVLGKDHPVTLASMNNLAIALENQGKCAEAEAMHKLGFIVGTKYAICRILITYLK